MNMGTHFLARFRGSEDSDDRKLRLILHLGAVIKVWQLWVKVKGRCLIVIDAIESDAKKIHEVLEEGKLEERSAYGTMVIETFIVPVLCTGE